MQRRGLQELLLCMKVVGHAPDSLDRRVLGQAIMANTVGRRYVPPTLSALHVLGWIPPNVDVDRCAPSARVGWKCYKGCSEQLCNRVSPMTPLWKKGVLEERHGLFYTIKHNSSVHTLLSRC